MGIIRLSLETIQQSTEPEKLLSASQQYTIESIQGKGTTYESAYALLDSFFGPRGELEDKEILGSMLEQRDIWFFQNTLFTRYHMLAAYHHEQLVGVRDCYTEIDPARKHCLIALSHSFVVPEHRRSGLASLFREIPVSLARELCGEFFPNQEVPIIVSAEMEPAEPQNQETLIRYIAYGKSGFSAIDPTFLPYSQPDFRDLEALGFSHVGIPLVAVVRWVGHEQQSTLPIELASAFPRHYNGFHYRYTKQANVDAMIQHALSTLAAKKTQDVPLLQLPSTMSERYKLAPLLKSRVLPLYPTILRGEHAQTLPYETELELLRH